MGFFFFEKIISWLVELYYRRYNCLKLDIRFFNFEIIVCIYIVIDMMICRFYVFFFF